MKNHPLNPCLVHRLPPAPSFVGRTTELEELRSCWRAGQRGVLALVGLGGAGKTAVAAHFLEELLRGDGPPHADGLFVWSFYQEPDAGLFLQEAYRYFGRTGATATLAKGAGLLHLLREALLTGGPHLLILDGLERVQRQESDSTGSYGQIEDPLLKGLLTRIAEGMGQTAVLVTSRFPLTDLASFPSSGYRQVKLGGLDLVAALALLRQRGVKGDEAALTNLVEAYGAHALTLDHLGGLLGHFLGGDPARAPEAPALTDLRGDRQAFRLARLLRAYEEHLPPAELALLCRLCLLRRSVREEQVAQLFLCSPSVHLRAVREILPEIILKLPESEKYPRDKLLDLIESIQGTVEESLVAAAIAGPVESFQQEVRFIVTMMLELHGKVNEGDLDDLVRLYSNADATTAERPLSARDRHWLRQLCARYVKLRDHPLLPFKEPDPTLAAAFLNLGWQKPTRLLPEDLSPADILWAFERAQRRMSHYVCKHFALRRVRQLCQIHQRKWALAGALAPLDTNGLQRVLDALVGRHLVLRDPDGSFSVHPAVRDHFHRLAMSSAQGSWHDLIREQLVSLVQRPGRRLPEDRVTLDLVEEAIYHTQEAGRTEEALQLYTQVLGGLRHLAWKLGEMARGLRILRGFKPCPDRWALGWYLRALGELKEAYEQNSLPCFRADVRLLQGRLPDVAAEGEDARTAVAAFLMGQTTALPPDLLGCAIPRAQVLLYLGRLPQARKAAGLNSFYQNIGWEGDRARCRLLLAEVARREGAVQTCREHLEAARRWVLHSGSVEHLCLLHLVQARVARDTGASETAQRAVTEGLHVARQCGLGLYHVELLCEQAELFLARADAPTAEAFAGEALWRASATDCQFRWGEAQARHLLAQALAAQRRCDEARTLLEKTLTLRRLIGDPGAVQTAQALAVLPG